MPKKQPEFFQAFSRHGEKAGRIVHLLVKNKSLRITAIVLSIVLGVLSFMWLFSKYAVRGKKDTL